MIFNPDEKFDFAQISVAPPTVMPGGHHFIKFSLGETPIYIQPPRCITKQGIGKSGKKLFCDLMFSIENSKFIKWIEDLETHAQSQIFDNRANWFESDLELHDIENSMTSPLKTYKSGQFYLLRAAIPTLLGTCSLKIFNEQEDIVAIEDIVDATNVITILEIRGIRCSARSFDIDIEVRQMMVLVPQNIFEKCIIHAENRKPLSMKTALTIPQKIETVFPVAPFEKSGIFIESVELDTEDVDTEDVDTEDADVDTEDADVDTEDADTSADVDTLCEVDVSDIEASDTVYIRPRTELYYEMYRNSMRKAKSIRNLALSAFMEAKRIKDLYMLDDIKDDNDDEELDEDAFSQMAPIEDI